MRRKSTRDTRNNEWVNWSGSVRFRPAHCVVPRDEQELITAVQAASEEGRRIRPIAALHSSSPIIMADDVLISIERLKGLIAADPETFEASLHPGTLIGEAGRVLRDVGLAMHTVGDIDTQTVAGAVATGTHGTGRRFANLATMLVGGRLVLADGSIREFHERHEPEFVRAVRCSLGVLGILSEVQLQLIRAPQLRRREWCCHIDDCLSNLDRLIDAHRNFDFYWYPRRDEVKLRTVDDINQPPMPLPFARLLNERTGWLDEVIAEDRQLKFDEIEYAVPLAAGPACFQEVRERIKTKHRKHVGWRVLYRTVAADDAFLSTAYGREAAMISAHHNAGLPFQEYFDDLEAIFRAYDGRPHWGKKHSLTSSELRPLYPMWDRFLEIRRELDPAGVFLTPALGELFGIPPEAK